MIEQLIDECYKVMELMKYTTPLRMERSETGYHVSMGSYGNFLRKGKTLQDALLEFKMKLISEVKDEIKQESESIDQCRQNLDAKHELVGKLENLLSEIDGEKNVEKINS